LDQRRLAGAVRAQKADTVTALDRELRRADEHCRAVRILVSDLHLRGCQHMAAGTYIGAELDPHLVMFLWPIDPLQPVQFLLASPGLAIALSRAVLADELFLPGDELLLLLVLLAPALHALFAHGEVLRVGRGVVLQSPEREVERTRRDAVEKV